MFVNYYDQVNRATTAQEAYRIFEEATQHPNVKLGGSFFHTVLCKLAHDNGNHVKEGKKVFTEMKRRNIAFQESNYDKLIFISTKVGDFVSANDYLTQEAKEGIEPTLKTVNHYISGCINFNQNEDAFDFLSIVQKKWHQADEYTQKYYNILIRQSVKEKNIGLASRVYDLAKQGLFKPDLISFNHLVDAYANKGDVAGVVKLYKEKSADIKPDRITFNSLIKAGVIARNKPHIHQAYLWMKEHGLELDENLHKHCWKIVSFQWEKPIDERVRTKCQQFYATCQKVRDVSALSFANKQGFAQLQTSRMAGSNTLANNPDARVKWLKVDAELRAMAQRKEPMTRDLIRKINQSLGGSGVFRTAGQEVAAGGEWEYVYAPGEKVKEEMDKFDRWLTKSLELCDSGRANPIEIAAEAGQRIVSIHPFSNENGRTSRLIMDYILERYQLPPAAVGKDIKVAIFAFAENEATSSTAVESVLNGVKRSYNLLSASP